MKSITNGPLYSYRDCERPPSHLAPRHAPWWSSPPPTCGVCPALAPVHRRVTRTLWGRDWLCWGHLWGCWPARGRYPRSLAAPVRDKPLLRGPTSRSAHRCTSLACFGDRREDDDMVLWRDRHHFFQPHKEPGIADKSMETEIKKHQGKYLTKSNFTFPCSSSKNCQEGAMKKLMFRYL